MSQDARYQVDVQVETLYIEEQSQPDQNRYVFAYTITLTNSGTVAAKLLTRHWIITDSNGRVEEVRGEGVVGKQPYLRPGESFRYTSGTLIQTQVGSMRGTYHMIADDGVEFEAQIPAFTLSIPRVLH
ncbi:Co2+/Mg2+ efflux protein ApaG [Thiohalobacter sp.]|uniref:Co2+/Mg2+ efflux protein ApaG n=1 Tax=Thiohalobacter sp. TaxID=2025948 RepID=UPI002610C71B|nr:Co2+/Mg2+ efflux protein ApaG [Thiohalobacter sp.]